MIFKRREPISLSFSFAVTDTAGQPVDPKTLDRQTDNLMELLEGAHSKLFRDLDVDAVLNEGTVTFSVEVVRRGASPMEVLAELVDRIAPAIQVVGGHLVDDQLPFPHRQPEQESIWRPEALPV